MAASTKSKKRGAPPIKGVKVVDLFCGIGGLSHGLVLEGFNVVAGLDNDKTCKHAFEKNNSGKFIGRDIKRFASSELEELFEGAKVRVLVGCAPCQPFSTLTRRRPTRKEAKKLWYPLYRFMALVKKVQPDIVSMENVSELANEEKYPVFAEFLATLRECGYETSFRVIDCARYGVPQRRRRLVLLASKLGKISLIKETHDEDGLVSVRDAIGALPKLKSGAVDPRDPVHRASQLSDKNLKRIASTPRNGGGAKDWHRSLRPKCYQRKSGKSYMCTVYGRMRWEEPAPTMTTHCTTLGTGRFGHPSQNRAISLREAAILQSFPKNYEFAPKDEVAVTRTARHIGNAVPVLVGRAIGRVFRDISR